MSPRGRRPQGADTRGQILDAARAAFAEKGYAGASLRAIARAAEVDPSLVHHYFDGKPDLFVQAVLGEADDIPLAHPGALVRTVLDGPRDELAYRWTRTLLATWDVPGVADRLAALLGGMATGADVRAPLEQFLRAEVFEPAVRELQIDDAELRVALVATQLAGIIVMRYVARIPSLAEMDPDRLARLVAPTLQRYLTAELD